MELARKDQRPAHVERLFQNVTVQALSIGDFKQAANSLPSRIENSFDVPKIWEMVKASGSERVQAFIEFELIKLAERVNVSGNLTDGQIQMIAYHMVTTYPNETIADFKICLEKASNGAYGKIWKLDGIEVGNWVKSYLDEKYTVLENQMMKEREVYHNQAQTSKIDYLQLWKEAIEMAAAPETDKPKSQNMVRLNYLKDITDREIKEQGQEKPKRTFYASTSKEESDKFDLHLQWIRENFDARTGDKKPTWISESEWLKQLNKS